MRVRNLLIAGAALLAMIAMTSGFATNASASDVYTFHMPNHYWKTGGIDNAGIFDSTLTKNSGVGEELFAQYSVCNEESQYVYSPQDYVVDVVNASTSGHLHAHETAYLVDTYLTSYAEMGTPQEGTGLQKAVWNLWEGTAIGGDAGSALVANNLVAEALLHPTYTTDNVVWLQNASYQDQLMVHNPIPEPTFCSAVSILMMGGLAAFRMRRKV